MSTDCLTNEWCEMSVLGVKNTHIAGSVSLTDLIKYLMTLLHFCSVQDTSSSCDPTRAVNILTGSKPEIVLLTFFPWGCRKEAVGVSGGLDQVILDIFNFDIYNPQNSSSQTTPGSWTWNLEFVWKRKEKKFLVASCDFQQEIVEYLERERERERERKRERPTFSIAFEAKRIKFN